MKALFADGVERPQLLLKKKLMLINWPFLLLITAITLIGVAALYSVAGGSLEPWASRHVVRYCLGLALLFIVALSDMRWWLRAAFPLYLLALVLLALVILIGVESGGAKRWLGYGEMSFQPT
ncbi:MAG: FtsW/RodA/SpoVE family cell cycle protein, partial [Methyloceanibacter sp.]